MNKQREAVYGLRRRLLEGVDQRELILEDYVTGILSNMLDEFAGEKLHPDQWNVKGLEERLVDQFGLNLAAAGIKTIELGRHDLGETIFEKLKEEYEAKEKLLGAQTMRYHERMVMLSVIDGLWKDHLLSMDHLKEGIGLRGYAQQDPLVAYKRESFDLFEAMMLKFQEDTVRFLFRMQILGPDGQPVNAAPAPPRRSVPPAPPVASAARPARLRMRRRGRSPFPGARPPPRSTRWSASSARRSSASLRPPDWPAEGMARSPRSAGPERKSAATTLARAARERSTRSATG